MTISNLQLCSDLKELKEAKIDRETSVRLMGYPHIDKPWTQFYTPEALNNEVPLETLYEVFRDNVKRYGRKTAITYMGNKISYNKLLKMVDRAAKAFSALGVKENDIVTMMTPNIPENVISFYALNKIGAIADFVDVRVKDKELLDYLRGAHSKVAIITDLFIDNFKNIIYDTSVEKAIVVSPADYLPLFSKMVYRSKKKAPILEHPFIYWNDFKKMGNNMLEKTISYSKDRPICIAHTSGTTGRPKGVVLTNENFNSMVLEYKTCGLEFNEGDKFLNHLPPFLAYTNVLGINLPLSLGMNIIMLPVNDQSMYAKNILKYRVQHGLAGPADMLNFLENEATKNADFSFLKTLASGGGHLADKKKREINEFLQARGYGGIVVEGYGMTEGSSAICTNVPKCDKAESIGIPLPKMTVAVCDPETQEYLGYGEEGELCFSGPTIMKGYFNNSEATRKVLMKHADGQVWLHSGDLGYVDEDGAIFTSGRIKRLIVRFDGYKISPQEIENVISSNNNVLDCCVVGVFDEEHRTGNVPVASIVLKENITLSEEEVLEEIKAICDKKIIPTHLPKRYVLVKSIPLTKAGKTDYRALEKKYNEEVLEKEEKVKTLKMKKG